MTFIRQYGLAIIGAGVLAAGALPAEAHDHQHRYDQEYTNAQHVITVSCYRGPWQDVIWDRPNPVFTDSLVSAGYTFPEAHAIAERVCRDPGAVGSPGALRLVMGNILNDTPPSR